MSKIIGTLTILGFLLGLNSNQVVSQINKEKKQYFHPKIENQFQRIEQPLWLKGVVTASGIGLIGLELWWFVVSRTRSRKEKL